MDSSEQHDTGDEKSGEPPIQTPNKQEPTAAIHPIAPVFTFRNPEDFPPAKELAIEAALRKVSKQLESESADSFDDFDDGVHTLALAPSV